MTDIALVIVQDPATGVRNFDFVMDGADVLADNGLQTAVCQSLFCDRTAQPDDALPGECDPADRRGWWADKFFASGGTLGTNDRLGSRLWLLEGAPNTAATARLAAAYAREALAWLIDGKIATSITIDTKWISRDRLALFIAIAKKDAQGNAKSLQYEFVWSPTFAQSGGTSGIIRAASTDLGIEGGAVLGTEDGRVLGLE